LTACPSLSNFKGTVSACIGKFSFAYGGKDGVPFPVNKKAMDFSISLLENAIQEAKLGQKEKLNAIKRLKRFSEKIPTSE